MDAPEVASTLSDSGGGNLERISAVLEGVVDLQQVEPLKPEPRQCCCQQHAEGLARVEQRLAEISDKLDTSRGHAGREVSSQVGSSLTDTSQDKPLQLGDVMALQSPTKHGDGMGAVQGDAPQQPDVVNEVVALKTQVEFWKGQARRSSEALHAKTEKLQRLLQAKDATSSSEQGLVEGRDELERCRAQVAELERQLSEAHWALKEVTEAKDEDLCAKVAAAEQGLAEKELELMDRQLRASDLERQLQGAREEAEVGQQLRDQISEELHARTSEILTLRARLAAAEEALVEREAQLSDQRTKAGEIEGELQRSQARVAVLERQLADMRQILEDVLEGKDEPTCNKSQATEGQPWSTQPSAPSPGPAPSGGGAHLGYTGKGKAVEAELPTQNACGASGGTHNWVDENGNTMLHEAARVGCLDDLLFQVAAGADMEAQNQNKDTPLHVAASSGHVHIVGHLIASGADKEAKNEGGNTPLLLAAAAGRFDVVRQLVEDGANMNARNKLGRTALNVAVSIEHREIVEHLIENGADLSAS